MIILILFAFLGGLVTILSPCILPILPIILAGSLTGGKRKPYGIILGFVFSFTFFTLFLSSLVKLFNISADNLRYLSIVILIIFALTLLIPQIQLFLEKIISRFSSLLGSSSKRQGFSGGLLIGFSLGLLWTPCVGPILASVITLALTGSVSGGAFLITLAYSLGTALPMLAIMYGGRNLLNKAPGLLKNSVAIQKVFAVIMIITAVLIYFNLDRKFQVYILEKFPSYGTGLTSLENNNLIKKQLNKLMANSEDSLIGKTAPALQVGGVWLNSPALNLEQLKGHVVLLDFMTYSCINCIRTFPYLEAWHQAYQADGLVIIGIHSPEFEFEKNPDNVRQALSDFGLSFPVMQDNDFKTWQAYSNQYWPHTFLINYQGQIVYDHIGEGAYDATEAKIQDLLKERQLALGLSQDLDKDVSKNVVVDTKGLIQSPEIYFGSRRNSLLANGKQGFSGQQTLLKPAKIKINNLYLVGTWDIQSEYAQNVEKEASIIFKYNARQIFMVAGAEGEISVRIKQDGQDLGVIKINEEKLYNLVDNNKAGEHTIELIPESSGLQIFTFTFG